MKKYFLTWMHHHHHHHATGVKYTWKMVRHVPMWMTVYLTLSIDQLQMSVAKQMAITHVRLPYWQRLESKESMYEATARLHSVCWFDAS